MAEHEGQKVATEQNLEMVLAHMAEQNAQLGKRIDILQKQAYLAVVGLEERCFVLTHLLSRVLNKQVTTTEEMEEQAAALQEEYQRQVEGLTKQPEIQVVTPGSEVEL